MTSERLAKLLDTGLYNAKAWRSGRRYPGKPMRKLMAKKLGLAFSRLTPEFFAREPLTEPPNPNTGAG